MKRSKHSLSHYNLLSCNMGELVPVACVEVLMGDTIQHATSGLIRVSPLLAPVMHPVDVRFHHWFVPHRLVWDEWEDFITGGPAGESTPTFPTITFNDASVGSLADYLGVTPSVAQDRAVSALPFRAYAKIWNEFYRDQDLETELTIDLTSGADTTTNTTLQNCDWEKDYFTSARPWTQKGPEVTIPLTGDAPVLGIGVSGNAGTGSVANIKQSDGSTVTYADSWASDSQPYRIEENGTTNFPNVRADLSDVTAASVNDLRLALALQRYEEARARYGSRYVEYLRYLGVRSSDARLQRPEYLGGGKQRIQFSEVLQTADNVVSDEVVDSVGTLRGHGIGAVRSNRYRRFFEEHGYVITLMSVRPKTIYVQGLARTLNRRTKEDFWQQELQHIGQQEVLFKELYSAHATPDGVFGYQDRYDEYRRQESVVRGEFRTTALDFWHMGRIFSSDPALNATFVKANPTNRIYASTSTDQLWCMVNHSIQARRLVARKGNSYIF